MFRPMTRRAIASIVGFFLGWTIFQIVRPVESLPELEPPAAEIVAINLQSLGCTDVELKCPVFDVTFRRDGTGTYVGYANDEFVGKYEGTFPEEDFAELVDQIDKQDFFLMNEPFAADSIEETIVVEVSTTEGSHRVISYNWASMPSELRALHALIQYQSYYVEWNKVK